MVAGTDLRLRKTPQGIARSPLTSVCIWSALRISLRIHHHKSGQGLIPALRPGFLTMPPRIAAFLNVLYMRQFRVSFNAAAFMMCLFQGMAEF